MTEPTLGDRIRARRDQRMQQHRAAAQADSSDEIAALHARIDKLIAINNLKSS